MRSDSWRPPDERHPQHLVARVVLSGLAVLAAPCEIPLGIVLATALVLVGLVDVAATGRSVLWAQVRPVPITAAPVRPLVHTTADLPAVPTPLSKDAASTRQAPAPTVAPINAPIEETLVRTPDPIPRVPFAARRDPALAAELVSTPLADPTPTASSSGSVVAALAATLVGDPYAWGGTSPAGFDCSGLVWYVFQQEGRPLPRDLPGQLASGIPVARDDLQPGDLVFFVNTYQPGLSHGGIYLGNGRFVSAIDEATGVAVSNLASPYWVGRYLAATRPK